jgi:hypothetical protein
LVFFRLLSTLAFSLTFLLSFLVLFLFSVPPYLSLFLYVFILLVKAHC